MMCFKRFGNAATAGRTSSTTQRAISSTTSGTITPTTRYCIAHNTLRTNLNRILPCHILILALVRNAEGLLTTVLSHHSQDIYQCSDVTCNSRFLDLDLARDHQDLHNSGVATCSKCLVTYTNLAGHFKERHEVTCPACECQVR